MEIARKLRDNFSSLQEVLLFGRIFLLITVLPLMVRFLTLPRLMQFLTHGASKATGVNREGYKDRIVKYTDYLLARNFWIYKKTCLKRSLVLYHFLCPVFPELGICFGVIAKKNTVPDKRRGLKGHSWLTHNGEIFLEEKQDLTRQYVVTHRFPEKPSANNTLCKELAKLTGENRLLLYCSRVSASKKNVSEINNLLSSQLNWKFISEAAGSHNIRQLLYHNLKGRSNRGFVPTSVMEDLKKAYHETVARNTFNYVELQTILDALHRSGIEAIALKGAALAGVVYPDIGLRPMVDVDLLVKDNELAIADRVMTDLGYSPVQGLNPKQWYRENHFHLPPYHHVRKPVTVEIHWNVARNSSGDIGKWWERAICKNIMGYPVMVPSPEDMLIHLSIHLFNHSYDSGFVLRSLCDIFETLRHYGNKIDWKLLQDETAERRIEKQVHSVLQLARKFYIPQDDSFVPIDLDHADHHFIGALEVHDV
jgi:hypothetical protein